MAVLVLAASVQAVWAVHELTRDESPRVEVVTVPGPPVVVTVPEATRSDHACDGRHRDGKRKHKRKRKRGKRPPPRGMEGPDGQPPQPFAGVECSDDTHCTIDREVVEDLLGDPDVLARQARLVPSRRDGETVGIKLYGVRRGGLLHALGLHNGDLLTEMNGKTLDSIDACMQAFIPLRHRHEHTVELVRKGERMVMEYALR